MAREPRNIAASVHARLLNVARDRGEELQRLLVHYALERFLYRLGQSEHAERFVLKGAMLFRIWEETLPRATRDLDLLGIGDSAEASILTALTKIWQIEHVEDGLELDHDSMAAEVIRDRAVDVGLRVKCRVHLGSAVIPIQIDVGFGDAVYPSAELIDYPTLLELPAPRVLAYPKEAVVAEKTQAMVELGLLNTRLKDYFDLCHLARTQNLDGASLQKAMTATFDQRDTPIPREGVESWGSGFAEDSTKQAQWAAFQRRAGLEPEELSAVVGTVRQLVEPVVLAMGRGLPFDGRWPPRGPWQAKQES